MKLIRGWEKRYAPETTGGLRLSKANLYRAIGEEEGVGDKREGEVRLKSEGEIVIKWKPNEVISPLMSREIDERRDPESEKRLRDMLATEYDDPELELEQQDVNRWKTFQNVKIDDTGLDSPFLFCLSREPVTKTDWEALRTALPKRYDTWTITEDVDRLKFEIECGMKRWMGLNGITKHKMTWCKGWVEYSYDLAPPSGDAAEIAQMDKWFRKGKKYINQSEYRLAWDLRSPQWENMPDAIDVELTRTGLSLFKPWSPPEL